MDKLLKKSFLLGLGAASLTRKKVQKIVVPLVKKRLVSRKQALRVVKRTIAEGERERKRIQKIIGAEIKKAKPIVKRVGGKAKRKAKRVAKKAVRRIRR